MARQREYESLARLRYKKKELEKRIEEIDKKIKPLQQKIFDNNPIKEVLTKYGILKAKEQNTYSVPDNEELMRVGNISQKSFNRIAKVNGGDLKKLVGEEEFNKLMLGKIVQLKNHTKYYQLTAIPKNQESL